MVSVVAKIEESHAPLVMILVPALAVVLIYFAF
jgi:hypothetical protein